MESGSTPDALSEFSEQFKKQAIPYLVAVLPPELFDRGRESEMLRRVVELLNERLKADQVPIGPQVTYLAYLKIFHSMPAFEVIPDLETKLKEILDESGLFPEFAFRTSRL